MKAIFNDDAIEWHSKDNNVLLNPRMPDVERQRIHQAIHSIEGFEGHIWLATSGTSGHLKLVALSKQAILTSASSVNSHLQCNSDDVWLNPLPTFHVGGLAILARCALADSSYHPFEHWQPFEFVKSLELAQATFTSLVPAQVFDIIKANLAPPPSLRAVVVGGGGLSHELYFAAVRKGWKILPSYGMTECASQIATAKLFSWNASAFPELIPLSHLETNIDPNGYLKIKGSSLLTAYLHLSASEWQLVDPKVDGWFTTEDKATFSHGNISDISRGYNFIKIGGESVNLSRLEKILEDILLLNESKCDAAIVAMPDERLGHCIHLAVAGTKCNIAVQSIVNEYHREVFPFEKIRHVHYVEKIPRTPLGKILKNDLLKSLNEQKGH